MAWKGRDPDVQADFNQLIQILNNSRIQVENNALYQVIRNMIVNAQKNKNITVSEIRNIISELISISTNITVLNNGISAIKDVSFWTENDETAILPNSNQVIAGTGITLDYTVPGQVTISSSASGGGYWTPVTDGDRDETDLIFVAGECLVMFVPTP